MNEKPLVEMDTGPLLGLAWSYHSVCHYAAINMLLCSSSTLTYSGGRNIRNLESIAS